MSVVSEIKKGNKKIKAAQLDRITDISGRYFAEYNSSTGECKNPVAEPITNIIITGNSTKVNADPDIPNDYVAIEYIELKDKQYIDTGIGSFQDIEVTYQLVGDISEQKQYAKLLYNQAYPLNSTYGVEVRTDSKTFTTVNNTNPISIAYNNNKTNLSLSYRVREPNYLSLQLKWTIGASSETANVRVYNVKFTNNADTLNGTVGKIDGDFYPVIRKSDNKPGMYDKVSKQFFVNQGTGEFITGPELPGKILEVDTLTKRGKNFIKPDIKTVERNGVTFTVNNDGTVHIKGTVKGVTELKFNDNYKLRDSLNLIKGRSYNISLQCKNPNIIFIYGSGQLKYGEITVTDGVRNEIALTDDKDVRDYAILCINKIGETIDETVSVQINEASSPSIYEPYQQPEVIDLQPIHGIGELKDKVEVVRDVEYNQLAQPILEENTEYNIKITPSGNGSVILNGTGIGNGPYIIKNAAYGVAIKYGHVYLASIHFDKPFSSTTFIHKIQTFALKDDNQREYQQSAFSGNNTELIFRCQLDYKRIYTSLWVYVTNNYVISNVKATGQLIDLTQLFGAGNEPTTLEEFYSTPIGKLIQKGVYLPFSESNNRISKVTRYCITNKKDLGKLNWSTGWNGFYTNDLKNEIKIPVDSQPGNFISTVYKPSFTISEDLTGFIHNQGVYSGYLILQNKTITSVSDFKKLSEGVPIIYPLANPYYEDITDTPQGQALLNLTPYQPYTTEFEVNNDGTIEFGYWRQIDPLPDTYTRVKALVSDGNQFININFGNANNMQYNSLTKMPLLTRIPVEGDKYLWLIKYYKDNAAVFNYIPCIRNNDLKPGFYEVSTGIFHTNQGTGEFMYINDWSHIYVDLYVSEITYCSETTIIS